MNAYTLENAKAADRGELLEFLLKAFRTNDANHAAFETLYPDLFDATDEAMGCHRIIRCNGKIGACVGAYPMRVHVGRCEVEVFGIGQVSCAPELRGGGRMSALLADVCARMEASGAALSWLGGRRDRYVRFGWEVAGTNLHSSLDARSLGAPETGWTVAQAEASQLAKFWALRNRAAVCEEVSPEKWIARLMRGGKLHGIFLASRGKDAEAMCVANGESLLEWAGTNAGIHAILSHLLQTQKCVKVTYAPESIDLAARLFWDNAEWSGVSVANLRILNLAALLASYAPLLEKRVPAGAGVRLAIDDGECAQLGEGGGTLTLDRLTMTRLLFGPLAPSTVTALAGDLRWLDQVFPLPFILPTSSHV